MHKIFTASINTDLLDNTITFSSRRRNEIETNKDKMLIKPSLTYPSIVRLSDVNIIYQKDQESDHIELSYDLGLELGIDYGLDTIILIRNDNDNENIYITGSISRIDRIDEYNHIPPIHKNIRCTSKYDISKGINVWIQDCFDDIEWADVIHIINDDTINGDPTIVLSMDLKYQIEYARRLGKTVYIHPLCNKDEKIITMDDIINYNK